MMQQTWHVVCPTCNNPMTISALVEQPTNINIVSIPAICNFCIYTKELKKEEVLNE